MIKIIFSNSLEIYYSFDISIYYFVIRTFSRKLTSENSRLIRETNANTQIWESENVFLKNRTFDMENELKNLQFELLSKDDLIRQSVKKEDVVKIQEENQKIVSTVSTNFCFFFRFKVNKTNTSIDIIRIEIYKKKSISKRKRFKILKRQ